ncbi:MAG TPA: Ig-like domain-containing protein, partial [Thermoanaerobaculia bacterium]|nr:Ig-like domain-containing protein [Thermoanaerobaculia bacterium]
MEIPYSDLFGCSDRIAATEDRVHRVRDGSASPAIPYKGEIHRQETTAAHPYDSRPAILPISVVKPRAERDGPEDSNMGWNRAVVIAVLGWLLLFSDGIPRAEGHSCPASPGQQSGTPPADWRPDAQDDNYDWPATMAPVNLPVLDNDHASVGGLTVSTFTQPQLNSGTVARSPQNANVLVYTANNLSGGSDSFSYVASDANGQATATVHLGVTGATV